MEIISHPEANRENNRFNDGKCDCNGRLWISTVSQDFENGCATMDPLGSFYCLNTDLKTRKIIDSVIQVNGMAWSLDNRMMYLVDTCAFEILQFDFDASRGLITNRKTAVKIPSSSVIRMECVSIQKETCGLPTGAATAFQMGSGHRQAN